MGKTKRVAYGHYPFPHFKGIAVSQFSKGERGFVRNFDQCNIKFFIPSLKLGLQLTAIGELNHYLVCPCNHMVIGQNKSIGTYYEAGSHPLLLSAGLLLHLTAEKLAEKIVERVIT